MYMSPEVYGEDYGFEVDMWAFGVLFYYMLNKEFPFGNYFFRYCRSSSSFNGRVN